MAEFSGRRWELSSVNLISFSADYSLAPDLRRTVLRCVVVNADDFGLAEQCAV